MKDEEVIDLEQDKKDFIDALNALNELAEAFWEQDEKERACLTEAQIYESAKKILGTDNEDTLKAMHNYALGLAKTGRDDEAAKVLNEYLDLIEKYEKKHQN
ncbi:MAG: tetratricopeptide repeat protein [Sphaerochaetaceae bacterium]|nr:tetratricopeptide repeat protein [Sphaerochaetaceae bacterium]